MNKKMSAGSGLSKHFIEYESKKVGIDFSGISSDGQCFRNDASILFFGANSYKSAFICLDKEVKTRFENNIMAKDIEHLILPYYFNFRHYVELSLKALIVNLTKESPKITHDLQTLISCLLDNIDSLQFDESTPAIFCTKEKYDKTKSEVIKLAQELSKKITEYQKLECAVEYYRYIFEKDKNDLSLKHDKIELDYNQTHLLFFETRDLFDKLLIKLREIEYVYPTL